MEAILLPAAVAMMVFIAFPLLFSSRISSDEDRRKKSLLEQMSLQSEIKTGSEVDDTSLLKEQLNISEKSIFLSIPGTKSIIRLLLKAGLGQKRVPFFIFIGVLFVVLLFMLRSFGIVGFLIAVALTYFLPRKYLLRKIAKRNETFINLFPDAIDMIVRSVRSGHPLNTAMRMIADNMENPVREEFKQVVDEISYGRTLSESLSRLSQRVDEQDVQFFVVVLSVQQETGGSLAEVLTNLSAIIRRRRMLRLKIRAITSEGRATSYILGALPVVVFGAIYWITPGYLDVLFTTSGGHIILGCAIGLIVFAMWIVNAMVNIEI